MLQVEIWSFPVAAEEFHRWSYQLCIGEYIDAVLAEHRMSDEDLQQLVVWRQSLSPAVAVDVAECHADQESKKEVQLRDPFICLSTSPPTVMSIPY